MSYYDPDLKKQVLTQDAEQVSQSTQKARESRLKKEQADYEKAVKEYEKDAAAAEAQYQKDLAEYNKKIAEVQKEDNKFKAEKARLEAEKQEKLAKAHRSVWGEGGSRNRSELKTKENKIIKEYNILINKVSEQERRETGYQEFRETYPGVVLPRNVAETFRDSPSSSLVGLYQQKIEGKAAKAEYQRRGSAQTAQAVGAKMSAEYHGNIPNIGFISSGLGTERGSAVKDLPKAPEGKKAVESRRPLINVKTHETIYGGLKIEANPRAFVASLSRQDVDAAGRPKIIQGKEGTQSIFSFENISNVQDPSAIALLEFQQQLKTKTAPSATVYKGLLEERGLPVTPLASRIIDTYSSKGLFRGYTEPKQAKGRKAIIKQDGKQVFDIETGMGDVNIGRKLGFVYDYNLQKPTFETPKTFEGSLGFVVAPKVQGPQQPKLEEAVGAVGTIDYALAPEPKQTSFNKSLENQYNKLGELQEITQKKAKSGNITDVLVQIAYAPSEVMRSVIGAGGSIVNLFEQTVDPITEKQLNLKRTARPAPIIFQSDVAGTVVLPYQFEKGRFDVSFEEYAQRQSQFIEKKGLPVYVTGLTFDYAGLKGVPSLIKTGIKSTPRLVTKIASPKRQLLVTKGGIAVPSKTWDIAEKIGFRKGTAQPKIKTEFGKITTQQPVPNPFGKERVIPYNLQKAQTRFRESLQAGKTKAVQVGGKIKRSLINEGKSPNLTQIQSRNIYIPNITRPERTFSKIDVIGTNLGITYQRNIKPFLYEMGKTYRKEVGIPTPKKFGRFDAVKQKIEIGVFKEKQKLPKTPKLRAPRYFTQVQRGFKGYVFMQKKRFDLFKKSTPRLGVPKISFRLKTLRKINVSKQIKMFEQKQKLEENRKALSKLLEQKEIPKETVNIQSKNFWKNIQRRIGTETPINDIVSKIKPFQRPDLRKMFPGIPGGPIGKVKGITSRKEFGELLKSEIDLPKTKLGQFPFKSRKKDLLFPGSYDIKRQTFLSNIQKIRRKDDLITQRQTDFFKMKRLSYLSSDTGLEILQQKIKTILKKPRGIARIKSETQSLVRRGKLGVSAKIEKGKIKNIFVDLNPPKMKSFIGSGEMKFRADLKGILFKSYRFEQLQRSERFSAPFTRAGFGIKEKSVKQLIGEGLAKSERIRKIKNIDDLKAPAQTIKPIFPVPRKPTELENILEGFKKEKKTGQPYKSVRIDKYVPKYPKSWEAWRGVGIVTAAGTISALGLGSEKAEALPFASIGKLAGRTVESGGQILIYPEVKRGEKIFESATKPVQKYPSILVPPTIKERQKEDEETLLLARTKPQQIQTFIPKISFSFSTPQKIQESIKIKTIQTPKISVIQSSPQKSRQRIKQRPKQISKTKYKTKIIARVTPKLAQTPKLASPLAPKAPTKLKAPQRQPLREKPKQISLLRERPPRRPPRVVFALPPNKEPEKPKTKKTEKQEINFFLGNVPETQISGIFKRKEITLGKEKIQRIRTGDVRVLGGKPRATSRKKQQYDLLGFKKGKTAKFF